MTNVTREIIFKKLSFEDIPLIHQWFNMPHVQEYYSLRSWSEIEVLEKLKSTIQGEKAIIAFMVLFNKLPIGYVQFYKVADYPWPEQDLPDEISQHAAGIDLFIGDSNLLGKGIGVKIVQTLLDEAIWHDFQYCVVDPDVRNQAAISCYERLGFIRYKIIHTQDALNRPVDLSLILLKKGK